MPADLDWPLRAAFQPKSAGPSTGPLERLSQSEREVRNREWPLSFVAQIDFAELHAVSALDGFPSTGRLLFFCDAFDWPWGEQEDQARAHVIFTQAPRERLERKPFPPAFDEPLAKELMPRGYGFKPRRLRPMAWLLPPRPAFIGQYDWPDWTVADDEACRQFWYAVYARWPETFGLDGQAEIHQMGGIALSIQEPVETACAQYAGEGPASADDWQLVLQIDSDIEAGMEWGDSGRLYVCARKQDLGAARFDRCWTILQCY